MKSDSVLLKLLENDNIVYIDNFDVKDVKDLVVGTYISNAKASLKNFISTDYMVDGYANLLCWDPGIKKYINFVRIQENISNISASVENYHTTYPSLYLSSLCKYCELGTFKHRDVDSMTLSTEPNTTWLRIPSLPVGFVRVQLIRAMASPHPAAFFQLVAAVGCLEYVCKPLYDCIGIYQNPEYHAEPVYQHLVRTLNEICKYTDDPLVRLAALLHDVGKPSTKTISVIEDK